MTVIAINDAIIFQIRSIIYYCRVSLANLPTCVFDPSYAQFKYPATYDGMLSLAYSNTPKVQERFFFCFFKL